MIAWPGINYVSRRPSLKHAQLICNLRTSCPVVLEVLTSEELGGMSEKDGSSPCSRSLEA
jgi:hypothetical protein